MTYKISKKAKMDLARIYWRGVREFGDAQAEKYYNALIDRFESIAENPLIYPMVDHVRLGYRRSVCGADSIYYQMNNDHVEIMRVLGRQDTTIEIPSEH
jgi:toxin ParE1/3/4